MNVPEKTQFTANALSRVPIESLQTVNDIELESAVEKYIVNFIRIVYQSCKCDTDIFFSKICEEQEKKLNISKI